MDAEVDDGDIGMDQDVMGSEQYRVDHNTTGGQLYRANDMLPVLERTNATDAYDVFAEAVIMEAIPFFQLAPGLFVVTGWDSRQAKRTVSGRPWLRVSHCDLRW